jgi:hypothetical protein
MRVDLKLNGVSLLCNRAGRNRTAVGDYQISRRSRGSERDGVGLSEGGVNKRKRSAGIDHRKGGDRGATRFDGYWKKNRLLGMKTGDRQRWWISSGDESRSTRVRVKRIAQRWTLYCHWAGAFPGDSVAAAPGARAGRAGSFGQTGHVVTS